MRLYALCDQDMLDKKGVSLKKFLKIAKSKNAEIIQYRNKNAEISFIKEQLIFIRKHYNGCLIVNDVYELIDYCDGVHVGQEDLRKINEDVFEAVKTLRTIIKEDKILGISTHNEAEVIAANDMNLNYIGLGAFRSTSTKEDISVVLGDSIEEIASKSKHAVAAIGGIKLSDKLENITYHVIGSGLVA